MKDIRLIVVIASLIAFGLATLDVKGQRINLLALGLFFMALTQLLSLV
jgi:hypothetical protein